MVQRWFTALTLAAALVACSASRPPSPANLPAPTTSTTLGVGDTFGVHIVGEKELPEEYRIAPDGTVDYPYVGRLKVSGLEPQQVVDLLRSKLIDGKVLINPQVSVIVKSYTSKKVTVIGQVTRPGSVPWADGLKIVDAISQSGWFTASADSNHVVLTREVPPNKTITAIVSIDAITDGQQADIPLQAGDTIKVESRVF
jgi:polysaccharide export outer membrane protein